MSAVTRKGSEVGAYVKCATLFCKGDDINIVKILCYLNWDGLTFIKIVFTSFSIILIRNCFSFERYGPWTSCLQMHDDGGVVQPARTGEECCGAGRYRVHIFFGLVTFYTCMYLFAYEELFPLFPFDRVVTHTQARDARYINWEKIKTQSHIH